MKSRRIVILLTHHIAQPFKKEPQTYEIINNRKAKYRDSDLLKPPSHEPRNLKHNRDAHDKLKSLVGSIKHQPYISTSPELINKYIENSIPEKPKNSKQKERKSNKPHIDKPKKWINPIKPSLEEIPDAESSLLNILFSLLNPSLDSIHGIIDIILGLAAIHELL